MKHLRNLAGLSCLLLSPVCLVAQFETASVLGYVRDSSGAVVPNASVTLVNQQTKTEVTVTTDAQGAYQFTDVKIGDYIVTATAAGFSTGQTQSFLVQVNARQRVDVALRAGGAESVTVTASTVSLLETDSSERGQVIGTREVQNLPLNGRAYADLAALVPGVRRNILENGSDSSRDASFNVNGQRSEFNNFLLDGLDNNAYGTSNQGFSNQAIPPSPDAISEFKVETDNYSAEYGRSAGAVINVSINSGTNKFHGKAYDYIRNTAFNAIGPFSPTTNPATGKQVKPVLIRNQFGGTLGGPIWKDHTFIFGDYEGTRQITRNVMQASVPNPDQNGTSALAISNGGYIFKNAMTGAAVPLQNPITGTVYTAPTPTSGTVIPFNDPGISAFAKGVLTNLPQANVAGAFTNNYASQPRDPINDNKGDIRLDHTFTEHTNAFFRYSEHRADILSPPSIQGPAGGNANGNVLIFNQQYAGGVTHVFSQNSILDARFAYAHTDGGKSPYGAALTNLMTGIPGLPTNPQVTRSLNVQNVSNFTQFGNQGSNPQFQNPSVYNPKINYTRIVGRSTYKVGYEYQAIFTQIDDFNPTYGQSTYSKGFSYIGSANTLSSADIGTKQAATLADFLFGAQDSFQLNNFVIVHLNQRMHYMYLQDDIRFTDKLTVNAGLRYELVTPQWESDNKLANFDPGTASLIQASSGSLFNRARVHIPKLDFAPRIGLAYSATNKTVFRAGYGISYAQFNREGGENLLVYNLPNIVNTNINQIPAGASLGIRGSSAGLATCTSAQASADFNPANPNPCFRLTTQGFPNNFVNPANVTAASNASTQARYIPANLPTGYVQAWHATVQQQVAPNTTFEVSYVGEHGTKLQVLADYNQASGNPLSANCHPGTTPDATSGCVNLLNGNAGRPLKTFTTIEETLPAGYLSYNALQTKLEHRTSHGLYVLNSFTWSHAIDNASGHLDANNGDNSRINLLNGGYGERGNSGYNQPLNETLSLVYDLPYGKGRAFGSTAPLFLQELLGGWQITAIENAQSGQPINITYSPNGFQQLSGLLNQRPNQLPGVAAVIPKGQRVKTNGNQQLIGLNFNAFSLPDVNHPYGTASRNSVRFDPYYDTDIGLHKAFALYPEGTVFDFRVEAFNILNQVNYAVPSSGLSSGASSFGTVNASGTFPARVLQFAGKIIF